MAIYLIQTIFCWGLFYLTYKLFLNKSTFFKANRYFIITTSILAIIIPFISISIDPFSTNLLTDIVLVTQNLLFVNLLETVIITAPGPNYINWNWIITYTYLFGIAVFALRFAFHYKRIQLIAENASYKMKENLGIFIHNKAYMPFSFLNKIYIAEDDYKSDNFRMIFEHEKVHINQKHYLDLILFEILTCLFWFNPFVWLMNKKVKETHEYMVDDIISNNIFQKKEYQKKILEYATGVEFSTVNNFSSAKIKNRITMMQKNKTNAINQFRFLVIIPIIAFLISAFSIDTKQSDTFIKSQPEIETSSDFPLDTLLNDNSE